MKNKILSILKENKNYVSGQQLSNELGCSRTSVWKAINQLRGEGYVIDSVTNKGYLLIESPNIVSIDEVNKNLTTTMIGKEILLLNSIDSTNNFAKDLGAKNYRSGTVVVAREQQIGKGRMGRAWISNKDQGIYFTILLRPQLSPMEISGITPLVGLAICKALNSFCNTDCKIKWPNDIIINNKKIVGILTEMVAEFDAVEYVVVGIGINCDEKNFPEEISQKATSLYLEKKEHFDKSKLLAHILNNIEKELLLSNYKLNSYNIKEYSHLCATVKREVTFKRGNSMINGVAVDVNTRGELIVMLEDGTIYNVNSGEVTVQGIY